MDERLERPGADEYAPFYRKYVERVPEGDIVTILRDQLADTRELLRRVPTHAMDFAYAPGKWSIKEVVGHLCDAERVFAYRALRFARDDRTPLPGYDENAWMAPARYGGRAFGQVVEELTAVRTATVALFLGLPPEAWTRSGEANGVNCSVRALASIIAGHELHHRAILEERYLGAIHTLI